VIARVVTKRDDARLATVVTVLGAMFLALVLADDLLYVRLLFRAPEEAAYLAVACAIAMAGMGPLLAWSRRAGRATTVRCDDGAVHAGKLRIAAGDVSGVSVVQGARGTSVAVAHGTGKVAFFELERAEDAARIAATLGAPVPPLGALAVGEPRRALAIPQVVLALLAPGFAVLYYLAATHAYETVSSLVPPKEFFGLGGVLVAELAMVLLLIRSLAKNHAVALGRGAWYAHAALHRAAKADAASDDVAAEPARVGNLARGDERVGAWLARIDAMPTEQHAYRGDAMKKDVLWDTLGDDDAPVDARMAAARVLRRRYGEDEGALVRVVEDPDVRVRVEAACEELDDAERRIETLGPLFRAR
jgi:hypothetical protein